MDSRLLRNRARTAEAMTFLAIARMLRAARPTYSVRKLAGKPQVAEGLATGEPQAPSGIEHVVSAAIERGSYRLPMPTTCLDRAIAGRWMLLRRSANATIVIGLLTEDPAQGVHAWLVGDQGGTITGAQEMADFTAITHFR